MVNDIQKLVDTANALVGLVHAFINHTSELEAKNKKLVECLEFYAKKENYHELLNYKDLHSFTRIGYQTGLGSDDGELARKVLEETNGR